MFGKITDSYQNLNKMKVIGHGGFGQVYKISDKLVVKKEHTVCLSMSNIYMWVIIMNDSSFCSDH